MDQQPENTFTLEDYQSAKFTEFWISDEMAEKLHELTEPLRQFCIDNGVPMVVMFGTGNNEEHCRISSAANFLPLSRCQPELLLSYWLANNGPSDEYKELYNYMESVHASKFPIVKESK